MRLDQIDHVRASLNGNRFQSASDEILATHNSVFEEMDARGKACAVVNFGNEEEAVEVMWPGGERSLVEILIPFPADAVVNLPVRVRLVPRPCVVVIQK